MKHDIRINGEVQEIDCELGSGVFDKNGKEIFEGDIVSNGKQTFPVIFIQGAIAIRFANNNYGGLFDISAFEVVGHVNATPFKDTRRAWSPQLRDAYNRLLDAFIACKSPQTVCEAALAVVKAAKADNRFDED